MTKRDLFTLSSEINGAAMIIAGLRSQLDNTVSDTLTPESLDCALFGIQSYLERIAEDLEEADRKAVKLNDRA